MARRARQLSTLAELFRILGDRTRLRILMELQGGPRNVSALVRKLRMPQPTVSHHLSLLRRGELVVTRRSGKRIFYSLNDGKSVGERTLRAVQSGPGGLKVGPLVFGVLKS